MHILYLQQLLALPGSPGTQRSWEMAKHWHAAGHEVSIICSHALLDHSPVIQVENESLTSLVHEGIQLHVLSIPYSHFMSFSQRLQAFYAFYRKAYKVALGLENVELVLAYSAPLSTGFLGRKIAHKLACPFVFEVADVWPDVPIGMGIIRNPLLIRFLHWQTKKTYDHAAVICTFTEDMKEQIHSHGVGSFKVRVIHNGVNLTAFNQTHQPEEGKIKVVYAGSLGRANGISQLLYAWKRIEKKWSDKVTCHIIGEGTEGESLRDLAKELGLRSMFFHEPIPQQEMITFLQKADIGLVCISPFPVLEANGSTKAFEYMAAGVPLVLNYEGWLAEYLKKEKCGLSASLGHIESFAQSINRLILDKKIRKQMGQNARLLAESKFDRKLLADKMLDIFKEVQSFT